MNKLIFFIAVFTLCIVQFAEAQKAIGLRVGGVGSNFKFTGSLDEDFDSEMQYSLCGGIFYNQPIGQGNFSVSPELMYGYQRKNRYNAEVELIKRTNQPTVKSIIYTEKVNTFDVNILFRYKFPAKFISPYIETGPSWVISSNANQGGTMDTKGADGKSLAPLKYNVEFGSSSNDTYRSTTFGWIVGAGLSSEFDFGTLGLGIRYFGAGNILNSENPSFSNNLKDPLEKTLDTSISDEDKMGLRNVILNISYTYPLGGYR
jgi:hypothetical protein